MLIELGLGIKALDVAHAADQKDPDDGFGLRLNWGSRRFAGAYDAVTGEHCAEGQTREAHADVGQKCTAVRLSAEMHHRTVTKSLWLNKTCTRFSRARCCGLFAGATVAA